MVDFEISHNRHDSRFETSVDGLTAMLLYRREEDRIVFVSTRVPQPIEGRGIGSALARTGLEYASEQSLNVVPMCSFVRAYIDNHPEYASLVV